MQKLTFQPTCCSHSQLIEVGLNVCFYKADIAMLVVKQGKVSKIVGTNKNYVGAMVRIFDHVY